jgi:hypothetical protein
MMFWLKRGKIWGDGRLKLVLHERKKHPIGGHAPGGVLWAEPGRSMGYEGCHSGLWRAPLSPAFEIPGLGLKR